MLNGVLATSLGGNRVGKSFVTVVGCGLPIAGVPARGQGAARPEGRRYAPLVETVYRWALIGDGAFEIAFYLDRLSAVMTLIVTGVGSLIHIYSLGYMKDDRASGASSPT